MGRYCACTKLWEKRKKYSKTCAISKKDAKITVAGLCGTVVGALQDIKKGTVNDTQNCLTSLIILHYMYTTLQKK